MIMSHVLLWLLLVVSLSLQTCGVNSQGYDEDNDEKMKSNGGTAVADLAKQSECQPRETLIKVHDEIPDEMQYNIIPSCVPMQRCLGCCTDEAMTCVPTRNKTVKLEVLRIYPDGKSKTITLPFVNHIRCICRYQRNKKN